MIIEGKSRFQLIIDTARLNFYAYCRLRHPKIYTDNRVHLRILCETLQNFILDQLYDGEELVTKLMINLPPRHGKTLTIINLVQWFLGHFPDKSIINISYNENLSGRFARAVRDGIQEEKYDPQKTVYSDVFPGVRVKQGDASYQVWSLEGSHFSFLATSPGATLTGTGASGLAIIDDIVKNELEAYNERILESHYDFYRNTYSSRIERGAKELIIMTRWHEDDLCGRLLREEGNEWHCIRMPANRSGADNPQDVDMLCADMLPAKKYLSLKQKIDPAIFSANYDQDCSIHVDKLYPKIKEYEGEPPEGGRKECYIDTADEGADNLCALFYTVSSSMAYIEDIIYSAESMEKTEPETARKICDNRSQRAFIESNNGGRGFARNVERLCRESGNGHTAFEWFHQGENKRARILSNSTNVCNSVIMPKGWHHKWPRFFADISRLSRVDKWAHDDAPDALTGVVEKSLSRSKMVFI